MKKRTGYILILATTFFLMACLSGFVNINVFPQSQLTPGIRVTPGSIFSTAAATDSYTISFVGANQNPGNGQTRYIGAMAPEGWGSATSQEWVKIEIPRSGTIKRLFVHNLVAGTLDTGANNVTWSIDYDSGTATGVTCTTLMNTLAGAAAYCTDSTDTYAVTAGHYVCLKVVTPTYTTPPTTVSIEGLLYIE